MEIIISFCVSISIKHNILSVLESDFVFPMFDERVFNGENISGDLMKWYCVVSVDYRLLQFMKKQVYFNFS